MDPWKAVGSLSRQETQNLQSQKLHTFINQYLYPFSPYYRKVFDENHINPKSIKTVADLSRIPFTSKASFFAKEEQSDTFKDFVQQPDKDKIKKAWPLGKKLPLAWKGISQGSECIEDGLNKEFRPVFMTFTTGTTNRPVPFMYSNYDIENLKVSGARMLHAFGIAIDETLVNMFPYAPHLAFWQVVNGGLASNTLCLHTGGGKVMGTEGNINALLRMKPAVVLGVPSYVYHVMREAKEKGVKLDSIKRIVLGASRVTEGFKMKLAQLVEDMGAKNVSVLGTYGFTESRCAWGECPTSLDISSGYHLYPDKEIFEIIDPETGEVRGEGEDGEIVYTSIDSRASSMIRYRTGDFVRGGITHAPCPHCGLTVPRLSSDITRLSDIKDLQLSKIKGALVNLSNFNTIMSEVEVVDEWQVEIRKKDNDPYEVDELVIYVCTKNDSTKAQIIEEVKERVQLHTEVTPNDVVLVPRDELIKRLELETANKEKRIIDTRPKD